jgi:hypothetical protein
MDHSVTIQKNLRPGGDRAKVIVTTKKGPFFQFPVKSCFLSSRFVENQRLTFKFAQHV